jgi:hypothetical protein
MRCFVGSPQGLRLMTVRGGNNLSSSIHFYMSSYMAIIKFTALAYLHAKDPYGVASVLSNDIHDL